YWFLDSPDWQPDDALAAFLQLGPPPVYVGFGSMPADEAQRLTRSITEGLARAGKRGLLAIPGSADPLPPHVHRMGAAPHDRLLPHVSATVHHGGAGTTAASLRAGVPTTIIPFFGDQPFWARRVEALGVGPKALDRKTLTAEALASALVEMDDPSVRERARGLGERIRAEDGVAAAVRFIEDRVAPAT
ncbi:MAG TPA: glycosyltransferase, partial [Devosia sp.]|nr:glycosyltransferase [Devosia sp.]